MDITRRTLITTGLGAGLVIALPGTAVADQRSRGRPPHRPLHARRRLWRAVARRLCDLDPPCPGPAGGGRAGRHALPHRRRGLGSGRGRRPCGRLCQRGVEQAVPAGAHSVHVELRGLKPGREYFYRFRAGRHISAGGPHADKPGLERDAGGAGHVLRQLRPVRARLLHGLPAPRRGPAGPGPAPGRLPVRIQEGLLRHRRRQRPRPRGAGDRDASRTTASATRSTRPTPTSRPRTRPRRGWWSGTTTRWTTTGRTRSRRTRTRPS